ncbi:hypothetical protein HRD49_17805 [Corallococcus exiguus]|uniref:hypothetical protein n=1 Tax=Corallococcus TaxID=83461 RepID=UPI000EA2EC61|nr:MULTISPECIES: hypothetical protein [Corallococcus]NNC15256.1 hypothetical protein [Corallococcus exiguus]NRD52340.1 hypothetical protein [Corallococcus exiguus]NRD63609.1 hypothetical protein [Corallococcus exiguus]RKH27650.1 hypothetical protein D7V77_11030 [Corallococcus sp. CA041A]RKI07767.1 hypothetical protein D7Y15_27475 [Corallococcus sp. AB030]
MRKMRETGTALMNAREMRLVLASAPRNLMELSRRELMGMVRRARGMVDQYEKLARRLRREAMRVPMGSRVIGGRMDTRRKAALFRKALTRFESQLRRMEMVPARKARPTMRKRPAVKKTLRPAARATAQRKKAVVTKKAMRPAGYARRGPVKARAHKARRMPAVKARAHKARRMPAMKAQAHRTVKGRTPARRAATR